MSSSAVRADLPARAALPVASVAVSRTAVAATAAAVVVLASAVAAIVVVTAGDGWSLEGARDLPVDLTVAVAYTTMGALVLSAGRRSGALGAVLLASGVASAVTALTTALALVATQPSALALTAVQAQAFLWVPGFLPLLTLVPLLYPGGLLPGRFWRVAAVAGAVGIVLLAVGMGLYPEPFEGRAVLDKPWVAEAAARALVVVSAALLLFSALAGGAALVVRLRRSRGLERRRVVVLLGAAGLLLLEVLVHPLLPQPAATIAQAVAVALVPIAIGVAVTRHRLYDLDLALCRALLGGSLAVCLAGAYLTSYAVLRAVLPAGDAVSGALAAGLTGLVVHPLGVRLRRGVDRLFYGDRADPYAVTSDLGRRLRDSVDVLAVPEAVCRTVVEALRLGSAQLTTDVDGVPHRLAVAGTVEGRATQFDLHHAGEVVGRLEVTPRQGERGIDTRDAALLAALCDYAAPAVAALRLYERLQQSREALVEAREEERRRLRRDLHDGVGAALAGVRLQLESARDLVTDPAPARLLDAAGAGVVEAIADVRQVTDELRPYALDEIGLAASLAGLAERVVPPPLTMTAEIVEVRGLPAAVEVACYRIAAEALTNAVRHSAARSVKLSLARTGAQLTLQVSDDGVGLPDVPRPGGLGLASMRQRAEEIGGELAVTSGPGGTTVRASFPVASRREATR